MENSYEIDHIKDRINPSKQCRQHKSMEWDKGNAPLSLKTWLLRCLPFDTPPYLQLTQLRDVVQTQCKTKKVLLCDDRFGNRNLCKPTKLIQ